MNGSLRSLPQRVLPWLVWIVIAASPLWLDDWGVGQFAQYLTFGVFAMSLAFIWGQAGILCFGQAIFFGAGAYLMALTTLGRLPGVGASQSVGLVLAVFGAAALAALMAQFLFAGKGLAGAFFAIVTLAAAVIAERAAQHSSFLGGFNGLLGVPPLSAGWRDGADAFMTSTEVFYAVWAVALVVFLALHALARSPFGTVLAAIRGDDFRTGFLGYRTSRYKIAAFTLAGAVAGLAGALFTTQFGFVSPTLVGFALSTEVLIWVAVGGRSALLAAFLGAVLVRSVESVLSDSLGNYWLLALGLLFVITVVVAPQGIFGRLLQPEIARRFRAVLRR